VERLEHVGPADHPAFYAQCRWTLNVTRADMIAAGYSPSVRLFEAAACGTPVLSDEWLGLDTLFTPGSEILTPPSSDAVVAILSEPGDERRTGIAARARARVLSEHTAAHRAAELERHIAEARGVATASRQPREAMAL
jgi:spore maturation protein CgeB